MVQGEEPETPAPPPHTAAPWRPPPPSTQQHHGVSAPGRGAQEDCWVSVFVPSRGGTSPRSPEPESGASGDGQRGPPAAAAACLTGCLVSVPPGCHLWIEEGGKPPRGGRVGAGPPEAPSSGSMQSHPGHCHPQSRLGGSGQRWPESTCSPTNPGSSSLQPGSVSASGESSNTDLTLWGPLSISPSQQFLGSRRQWVFSMAWGPLPSTPRLVPPRAVEDA